MDKSPRKEKKKDKKDKKKTPRSARGAPKEPTNDALMDLPIEPSGPTTKLNALLKDCPVTNVTIYNDRAEVTRALSAKVAAGTNEVRVTGLSSKVDSNSVRVSGGKGAAVILEVSYNSRWEPKTKDDGTEAGRLRKELEELEEHIGREVESLARMDKETVWLENWGRTISAPRKEGEATFFSPDMMEQAIQFMDFYQKRLASLDERRSDVEHSLKELRQQQDRTRKSLAAISGGETEQVNEVVLLLTAAAETDVELVLSYVVLEAAWHAAYDVRVESNSDKLSLTYYGIIVNNSLDHWNDASLSLSTAQPSIGGAPPELTTKFIGFRQQQHMRFLSSNSAWAPVTNARFNQADVYSNLSPQLADFDQKEEEESAAALQVMTSDVSESNICTSFNIPRKTTILSDNKPHKVTIRLLEMKAKFTYVIIPKLSTHAYLKASVLNTAENYPLLPGEMNVFMDGNFVAKSNTKAVSPKESFVLYLGIDDAIKVTYPPGVFFKETKGLLSKSNIKNTKHTITVKNTKPKDITVNIYDQLPKSNDSQIKVKLIKPVVEGSNDVLLTEANNLKWKKEIESGKEISIPFEYSLEWPAGQELTM